MSEELVPISETAKNLPQSRFIGQDAMARRGFNPLNKMMDLALQLEATDEDLGTPANAEMRFKIYSALSKFFAPQPKSVDVNINSEHNSTIQVVSFMDLAKAREGHILDATGKAGLLSGATIDVEGTKDVD